MFLELLDDSDLVLPLVAEGAVIDAAEEVADGLVKEGDAGGIAVEIAVGDAVGLETMCALN